jgi:hypothetical protein
VVDLDLQLGAAAAGSGLREVKVEVTSIATETKGIKSGLMREESRRV